MANIPNRLMLAIGRVHCTQNDNRAFDLASVPNFKGSVGDDEISEPALLLAFTCELWCSIDWELDIPLILTT